MERRDAILLGHGGRFRMARALRILGADICRGDWDNRGIQGALKDLAERLESDEPFEPSDFDDWLEINGLEGHR